MKKLFSFMLFCGALIGFTACDDDPAEGEPRTDFEFKASMNADAKDALKFNWQSAGWGTTMTILKWEIEESNDLPNSGKFVGKEQTMMNVSITVELKDASKLEDKTYSPSFVLSCKVTTRDANGAVIKTRDIMCSNPLNGNPKTKAQMISTFGDKENAYSMLLGVDVDDGNTIKITEENTNPGKYGSEPKG